MNLCTCSKRIAAIFFVFLTHPTILQASNHAKNQACSRPSQKVEWLQLCSSQHCSISSIVRLFGHPCWEMFVQHFLFDETLDGVCFAFTTNNSARRNNVAVFCRASNASHTASNAIHASQGASHSSHRVNVKNNQIMDINI